MSAIRGYTAKYHLEIPNFDFPNWHTYYARNLSTLDALIYMFSGISNIRGAWANSTQYALGDRVIDAATSIPYQCLVDHISSALPTTFDAERTAHPELWHIADLSPASRGDWVTATVYYENEFVRFGNGYYVCRQQHTSTVFATDLGLDYWDIVIDFTVAQDWAIKTTGKVADTDYSAKAWAIGGTEVSLTVGRGAAKEWAIKTDGPVDGTEFSAKYYAAVAQDAAQSISNSVTLKGDWDASSGTFPGGGTAQTGYQYRVSVDGTVDGVAFVENDTIVAITNNASTTTFDANWIRFGGSVTSAQIIAALGYTPVSTANVASQAEAEAGVSTTKWMNPLRVFQAIAAYLTANPQTPRVGTLRATFQLAAETGWMLVHNGSIGNGASGATTPSAAMSGLFAVLYAYSDANAPLQTALGAATTRAIQGSASTAFAAGCRVFFPKTIGRAIGVSGTGDLTARNAGDVAGTETETLTAAKQASMPVTASGGVTGTFGGSGGLTISASFKMGVFAGGGFGDGPGVSFDNITINDVPTNIVARYNGGNDITTSATVVVPATGSTTVSGAIAGSAAVTGTATGSAQAHNNTAPITYLPWEVKL